MDASPAPPAASPDGGGSAAIGALAWILIVGVALACRLWRFEAVGEGVDEGVSVETTRAMVDGRFSFSSTNEFVPDAFAARFQPVAEAIAVPFVWALGDRPLAFRLPWLIASIALLVALVRYAGRRFGKTAAIVLGALYALDYRNVYYAQTHRYVLATQVFGFAAFLATARALRVGRWTSWIPVVVLSLLLLHSHLMGAWVLLGIFFSLMALVPTAAASGGGRRRRGPLGVLLMLLGYAALMMLSLRSSAHASLYEAGDPSLGAALTRSASWTVRMVLGLGVVAGPLAFRGAFGLAATRGFPERAIGLGVLATFALWLPFGTFLPLEPRYAACVQPFVFLAAAAYGARALQRLSSRPALRTALVAACVAVTAAPTAWYLATGGARDVEAPILAALREKAKPGDAVWYDVPSDDVFHRRPSSLRTVSLAQVGAYGMLDRLDELGALWIVRPAQAQTYPANLESRLDPVVTSTGHALFQEPVRLSLYRVRARP